MEHVPELVEDGDPLVRENAVVTVAGVAEEYPRTAEPVFGSLLELRDEGGGTVRRYATEAIRHISNALSGATLDGNRSSSALPTRKRRRCSPPERTSSSSGRRGPESGDSVSNRASEVDGTSTSKSASGNAVPFRTGPPSPEDIESPRPLPVEYEDFEKLRPRRTLAARGRSPRTGRDHP